MHVLINILNNAKDALIINEIEEKYIFVDMYKSESSIFIEIKDNAKGIEEEVLHKVFKPYFTTKYDDEGTGIGLYMSKEIIEEHMDGKLSVKNSEYEYNNIKYKGASFIIELKL